MPTSNISKFTNSSKSKKQRIGHGVQNQTVSSISDLPSTHNECAFKALMEEMFANMPKTQQRTYVAKLKQAYTSMNHQIPTK